VGFSLAAFVSTLVQTVGFYQIAGQGPGERIAFGNSILALASQFSALFPPPFRPDTVGGYVEFRGFHPLAILFAIWALASATGAARGDEERGLVEASLAAGISRIGLIGARTTAFAIALVVASAAAAAFDFRDLGAPLVRLPMPVRPESQSVTSAAWWRFPVWRGMYERRLGIAVWAIGMAVLAIVFVSLTRTIVQVLLSIPSLLPYLSIFVRQQVYPGVLGFTWFNVAQLLFAALAITYVARWSAQDPDGRPELT